MRQAAWAHSPAGRAAGFTPAKLAEWGAATDWAKLKREENAWKSIMPSSGNDFWALVAESALKATLAEAQRRAGQGSGGGGATHDEPWERIPTEVVLTGLAASAAYGAPGRIRRAIAP